MNRLSTGSGRGDNAHFSRTLQVLGKHSLMIGDVEYQFREWLSALIIKLAHQSVCKDIAAAVHVQCVTPDFLRMLRWLLSGVKRWCQAPQLRDCLFPGLAGFGSPMRGPVGAIQVAMVTMVDQLDYFYTSCQKHFSSIYHSRVSIMRVEKMGQSTAR